MIKGLYHAKSVFIENVGDKQDKVIIRGLMLPKNKISRNGVMYEWGSIVDKHKEIIGRPVMYNHKIDTDMEPLGHYTDSVCLLKEPELTSKWLSCWQKTAKENNGKEVPGWYYEADLNPDNKYTKSVMRGDLSKVSIQLMAGESYEKEMDNGDNYTLAYVGDILEGSVVPTPGFIQTSIEVALAEALKYTGNKKPVSFVENILTKEIVPVFRESEENPGVPKLDGTGPNPGCDKKQEVIEPAKEEDVDPKELAMGVVVELEHTDDVNEAKIIALQHLAELPDYYTRLKKMEEEGMDTGNIPTATKLDDEIKSMEQYIDELSDEEAKKLYNSLVKK